MRGDPADSDPEAEGDVDAGGGADQAGEPDAVGADASRSPDADNPTHVAAALLLLDLAPDIVMIIPS